MFREHHDNLWKDDDHSATVDPHLTVASTDAIAGADGVGVSLRPHEESAWSLIADGFGEFAPDDLAMLREYMNQYPGLRASALMASLMRAKSTLDLVADDSPTDKQVSIAVADLLVMVDSLMRRLR